MNYVSLQKPAGKKQQKENVEEKQGELVYPRKQTIICEMESKEQKKEKSEGQKSQKKKNTCVSDNFM